MSLFSLYSGARGALVSSKMSKEKVQNIHQLVKHRCMDNGRIGQASANVHANQDQTGNLRMC